MAVMRLMMKKALMMLNVCDYACDGDDNDAYYDDILGYYLEDHIHWRSLLHWGLFERFDQTHILLH